MELQEKISLAYSDRELLKQSEYTNAIHHVIEELDKGKLRTAMPIDNSWQVNE